MGGQQTLEPDVVGRELLRLQAGGFLQGDGRIFYSSAAGSGEAATKPLDPLPCLRYLHGYSLSPRNSGAGPPPAYLSDSDLRHRSVAQPG